MFNSPSYKSDSASLRIFGAFLLTGFLGLFLLSCNGSSSPAMQTPPPPPGTGGTDVTTYHNDNARTGQNLSETILTSSNVNSTNFGKLFVISVDGKVDAQPLYLGQINVGSQGRAQCLVCSDRTRQRLRFRCRYWQRSLASLDRAAG